MQNKNLPDHPSILSVALFVTGATVGAGLLALPVQTGLAGIIPSAAGFFLAWGLMLGTGFILSNTFIRSERPVEDLPSLFEQSLGQWSKWLVIPGYLLVFYGVMVAYLCGSGSILVNLFGQESMHALFLLLFFIPSTAVILAGLKVIHKANFWFMILLLCSFVALMWLAGRDVQAQRYDHVDWLFLPSAMPIILSAFCFQNIVPTICRSLNNDVDQIRKTLILGTFLAFAINAAWILVVIGVLPLEGNGAGSIAYALQHNEPATVPLSKHLQSDAIATTGMIFSIAAFFTSYIAVGVGLRNFLGDLVGPYCENFSSWIVPAIAFLPPLFISYLYPELFLKVLNLVGGIGIVLLFGILPAFILIKKQRSKPFFHRAGGYLLLGIFIILMSLEVTQELGFLHIHQDIEHWLTK